jgi:hypothetical protein
MSLHILPNPYPHGWANSLGWHHVCPLPPHPLVIHWVQDVVCRATHNGACRSTHPHVPVILYISGGGGLLERMAAANPDCISIDQSVDIVDGIKRIGTGFAVQVRVSDRRGVYVWEGAGKAAGG